MQRSPGFRIFLTTVIVAVVAAVIGGLFLAGSPQQERMRRADNQRVQNLQRIASSIDMYWQQSNKLPSTLDELSASRTFFIEPEALRDPETQEPFSYRTLTTSTYELCATFQTEATSSTDNLVPAPVSDGNFVPGFWKHGLGRTCFQPTAVDIKNIKPAPGIPLPPAPPQTP